MKKVCNILQNNLDNTKQVCSGVAEIMVMIQNQDIIRQNIENLVKCLRIVREKKILLHDKSPEKRMDYVVFANRVLEMSKLLVDNIENSFLESVSGLSEHLSQMNLTVTDLEEDTHYLDRLFAGGEGNKNVLADVFNSIFDQIDELHKIKSHVDAKSALLLGDRETFLQLMQEVETDFEVINKEISMLKKMKVLIKIELSRINLDNGFTLTGIINAVDQVIDTINDNRQLFIRLRKFFLQNINELDYGVQQTKSKLELTADMLTGSKLKLETVSSLACGAVLASSQELNQIFSHLKQPYEHLADTHRITDLITDSKNNINIIHKQLLHIQNQVFLQCGVTQWEEKADDLLLLMEQFTSFVERKALTTVAGSVLQDIGNDGGDIVLF